MPKTKIITIIGASGFIGHNLIDYLLTKTDYTIRAFARNASSMKIVNDSDRVTLTDGDAFDQQAVEKAVSGADAVVYLLHMMAERVIMPPKKLKLQRFVARQLQIKKSQELFLWVG
jgi:uncharacterized protein YbjT (DUF2867 family)